MISCINNKWPGFGEGVCRIWVCMCAECVYYFMCKGLSFIMVSVTVCGICGYPSVLIQKAVRGLLGNRLHVGFQLEIWRVEARELLRWMPGSWGCFSKTFFLEKGATVETSFCCDLLENMNHFCWTPGWHRCRCDVIVIIIVIKDKHRGPKLEGHAYGDEKKKILNTCMRCRVI